MTKSVQAAGGSVRETASSIRSALEIFSRAREKTIHLTLPLTPEQAVFAPDRASWSIGQVLDHLVITEGLYRANIKRLLNLAAEGARTNLDVTLREAGIRVPFVPQVLDPVLSASLSLISRSIPRGVLEMMLRTPTVKVKSPKSAEPLPARPIVELRSELESSLAETQQVVAGPMPKNADGVTVTHPLFGRNNISNLFRLMAAHEERHGVQIRGIIGHSGFPVRPAVL